ncbi:hypothetical protein [Mycobacterium lepromatosis]|nr:hypothetical protein [Mycobacterium lepromatosis]
MPTAVLAAQSGFTRMQRTYASVLIALLSRPCVNGSNRRAAAVLG